MTLPKNSGAPGIGTRCHRRNPGKILEQRGSVVAQMRSTDPQSLLALAPVE